jgi:DNA-binding CsgD family transcriptional regulator
LLSVSSFTLLAIIILLFILFRYKASTLKKNAQLLEQENVIHAQDSRIKENENRILQEQLESKNRELASKALEMIRFNDTITAIIEKLDGLDNNFNSSESSKHIRSIIHELENQSKQNIWIEFDKIFKNIHSDFYSKLLERCPDLSPTEIKTAALLKLNLTTKEIAAITFKSEGGIKTTRYRLRKKLELSSDDKLIPFLMQI